MTWSSGITELSIFVFFAAALLNAAGQGRRWLSTLVWGAVVGFGLEVAIIRDPVPRYEYGTELFAVNALGVPVCIGLGWGLIFYVAGWTAQRLRFDNGATTAYVAGILGVNIDLSLDPVANLHGFWTWNPLLKATDHGTERLDGTLFEVPFDNFIAWISIIGIYSFFVRTAFRWVNHRQFGQTHGAPGGAAKLASTRHGAAWIDAFLPLLAIAPAAAAFMAIRRYAPQAYEWLGWGHGENVGQQVVFSAMFIAGLVLFWTKMFKLSARDEQPNWFVLATVVYFHSLSFALFFFGGGLIKPHAALVVMIPLNLVAGFLAFAWPYLDVLFDKAPHSQGDDFRIPPLTYRTLASYAGDSVRTLFCAPATEQQLNLLLQYAREHGKCVTFRAGGQAFDGQALNDEVVVSLERFKGIEIDVHARTVKVRCGDTWASILRETLRHGLAPYIMVTTGACTAGGTVSSHSMSRFSPTSGREGKYVESLVVLTPDGQRLLCSRAQNAELFCAVVGGLGYLGAVLEITYRLREVPRDPVVKTTYTVVEGLSRIGKSITPDGQPRFAPLVSSVLQRTQQCRSAEPSSAEAFSAAVNMRGGVCALIGESQYVPRSAIPGGKLKRSLFHSPQSFGHLVLQLFAWVPLLRTLGYFVTFRLMYGKEPTVYYDDIFGYTFFEDGHRRARALLQKLGCPSRMIQQTFMVPASAQGREDGWALSEFLRQADDLLHAQARGVDPAMLDVLYVGKDSDGFALSSSKELDAFAVTFTFERLLRGLDAERAVLSALSSTCMELGGRVHLVKNVHADPGVLAAMYGCGIATVKAMRNRHKAQGLVRNAFADRALPGLDA